MRRAALGTMLGFFMLGCTGNGGPGNGGDSSGGGGADGGSDAASGTLTLPAFVFAPKAVASNDGVLHVTHHTQTPNRVMYGRCASHCGADSSWTFVELEAAGGFITSSRLAVGADGRIHVVYLLSASAVYATCSAACENASNWTKTELILPTNCDYEAQNSGLVIDSQGRLSFMSSDFNESRLCLSTCAGNCSTPSNWQTGELVTLPSGRTQYALAGHGTTLHLAYNDRAAGIRYQSCSSQCTQASNWQTSDPLFYHQDSAIALAASPQGRVHLAFNQGVTSASAPAEVKALDNTLMTFQCSGSCSTRASWQGLTLGSPSDGNNGIAVTTTSTGAAVVSTQDGTRLHSCDTNCAEPASWRTRDLDTATTLTASLPDPYSVPGCESNGVPVRAQTATWAPERPSIAVTPSGAVLVHAMTKGLRTCPGTGSVTLFPGYGRILYLAP